MRRPSLLATIAALAAAVVLSACGQVGRPRQALATRLSPGVSATFSGLAPALPWVCAGNPDAYTLVLGNAKGLPARVSVADIKIHIHGNRTRVLISRVRQISKGNYAFTATSDAVGSFSASALVAGVRGGIRSERETVGHALTPSAARSSLSAASSSAVAGRPDTYTLVLRTTDGHPVTGLPNSAFSPTAGSLSTVEFSDVTPTETPGVYTFTATDWEPGDGFSVAVNACGTVIGPSDLENIVSTSLEFGTGFDNATFSLTGMGNALPLGPVWFLLQDSQPFGTPDLQVQIYQQEGAGAQLIRSYDETVDPNDTEMADDLHASTLFPGFSQPLPSGTYQVVIVANDSVIASGTFTLGGAQ